MKATGSRSSPLRIGAWRGSLALVLTGALVGVVTFGLAEGTHVAIALTRGSELEFGDYDSRAAIGAGLVGVHLAAGVMVGAGVGVGLAVLYAANARVVRFTSLTPDPSPSPRERGADDVVR